LLMYMGELITKRGIGNGISILIFASILTSAPAGINAYLNGGPIEKLFFPLVSIGVIVSVVFVQEGQRRIPIQYAKRMVGRRQTAGGSTYMPLRVNMAGVIPVIFAAALLALPQTIGSFQPGAQTFINRNFSPGGWTYLAVLPSVFIKQFGFSQATGRALGGTSVLIVVGVALDTMRQMESQMMMRSYEGFLR